MAAALASSLVVGSPGREQFADAQVKLRNFGLEAYIGALLLFREEYIGDDSLESRNGFDDVTLAHYKELLFDVDAARRLITDVDSDTALVVLFPDLIDQTKNLTNEGTVSSSKAGSTTPSSASTAQAGSGTTAAQGSNAQNAASINPLRQTIKMPSGPLRNLRYALDGTDPNIPLNSQLNIRNALAATILGIIDKSIVDATRCEDRFLSTYITPQTSQMFYGNLQALWMGILKFGGTANRILISSGTRRSEEPRGPGAATNSAGEAAIVPPAPGVAAA